MDCLLTLPIPAPATMKILYEAVIILLAFFVASTAGACLPCQSSTRRYTAWDTIQCSPSNLLSTRAIYNPKITSPTSTTVWIAGSQVTVTWDTSDLPDNIENPKGTLRLGYMTDGSENEHLGLQLASDFDLKDGYVKFKCPKVEARSNYIVVLFGDSGNRSAKFSVLR